MDFVLTCLTDCKLCFSEISLLELVQRILPVCSHYSTICRFMEGTVMDEVNKYNIIRNVISINFTVLDKFYNFSLFFFSKIFFWTWSYKSCLVCSNEDIIEGCTCMLICFKIWMLLSVESEYFHTSNVFLGY